MLLLTGILIVWAVAGVAHASASLPACAPSEGLSISGITFSDERSSALEKLGRPERTATYQGEDDGGSYTGSTLMYPQLELDVDELRGVERIASKGGNTELPYGLKPGMTLEKVATMLRFIPLGLQRNSVAVLPVCGALYDSEVRLHFVANELQSVEITQYGP